MTKFFVDEDGNYLGGFDGVDPPEGAIEVPTAPDNAAQIWDEGIWLAIPKTWDNVEELQNKLLGVDTEVSWRLARYKSQKDLTGQSTTETGAKFQEILQYCQDVRDADETNHATPQEAMDALNALTVPAE